MSRLRFEIVGRTPGVNPAGTAADHEARASASDGNPAVRFCVQEVDSTIARYTHVYPGAAQHAAP